MSFQGINSSHNPTRKKISSNETLPPHSLQPGHSQDNTLLVPQKNSGGGGKSDSGKSPGPFQRLSSFQKAWLVASWFTGVGLFCWLAYCLYDYATKQPDGSSPDNGTQNKNPSDIKTPKPQGDTTLKMPLLSDCQEPVTVTLADSSTNTVQPKVTQGQEKKRKPEKPLVSMGPTETGGVCTIGKSTIDNTVPVTVRQEGPPTVDLEKLQINKALLNKDLLLAQVLEREELEKLEALEELANEQRTSENSRISNLDYSNLNYMTDQQVNEFLGNQIPGNTISTNNIVSDPINYVLGDGLWRGTDGSGPDPNDPILEKNPQINLNEENDTEVQKLLLEQYQEEAVKKKQELEEKQKNRCTRTELCLKMNEETSTWEVVPEKKELSLEIYKELEEKDPASGSVSKMAEEIVKKINTGQKVQFSLGNALYSYQKVTNKLSGVSHIEETKRLKDDGDDDEDVVTARRIELSKVSTEVTKLLRGILTAHSTEDPLTSTTNEKASVDSVKEPVTKKPQRRKYFETTQDEKEGTLQRLRGEALLEKRKFYAGNTLIIPKQRDEEIAKDAAAWIKSYVEGGQTVEIRLSDVALRYKKPLEENFSKVLEQQEKKLGQELSWTPTDTIDDVELLEQHITDKLFDYLQKNPENSAPLPLEKNDKTAPKGNQKEESSEQPTPPKTLTPEEVRKKRLEHLGL